MSLFTDTELELLSSSIRSALKQWPTLKRAWGCMNCDALFAEPVSDNLAHGFGCPSCRSEAVFDVAAIVNGDVQRGSTAAQRVMELAQKLDEVLSERVDEEEVRCAAGLSVDNG